CAGRSARCCSAGPAGRPCPATWSPCPPTTPSSFAPDPAPGRLGASEEAREKLRSRRQEGRPTPHSPPPTLPHLRQLSLTSANSPSPPPRLPPAPPPR